MRRKSSVSLPTQHALLVVWGEYAQQQGLIEKIKQVALHQKQYEHSPQTKVLELLVATLAGLPYLQDVSRSAHPLDQDQAVAQAWGQSGWADYSGVSRCLQRLLPGEVQHLRQVLDEVSQPFIDQEVKLALEQEGCLVYDGDLTGLPVSKSSTTYPEIAYGHMDDGICLGYQAAVVSLRSHSFGRLWLSIAHHPGNTLSAQQAIALVEAAEASTGRRPTRPVELLAGRIQSLRKDLAERQKRVEKQQHQLAEIQQDRLHIQQQTLLVRQELTHMEQDYQAKGRSERPTSQLARLRQQVDVLNRRTVRREQAAEKVRQVLEKSQTRSASLQAEMSVLQERLERFQQENAANLHPIQAVFRLDAGFGTWENLTRLIEMGYEVYTKANNHMTVQVLHQTLTNPVVWQPVGEKAEMQIHSHVRSEHCSYPVDVGLERFQFSETMRKHSLLLHFGASPIALDSQAWFDFYNGRQTLEAGIKETKQVFYLHHIKVRSLPAIHLQEAFVLFAANFIRWSSTWIEKQGDGSAKEALDYHKLGAKRLVQVMAHTSAEVSRSADIFLLRFSPLSCLAGKELRLPGPSTRSATCSEKVHFFQRFRRFTKWLHNT